MSGYINKSMSVNAYNSYFNEEMPITRWTKKLILSFVSEQVHDKELVKRISTLTTKRLRTMFLRNTSWHHTGCLYNATNFYSFDDTYANSFTDADMDRIESLLKWEYKSERVKFGYVRYTRLKGSSDNWTEIKEEV